MNETAHGDSTARKDPEPQKDPPAQRYARALGRRTAKKNTLAAKERVVSWARLGVFVIGVGIAVGSWGYGLFSPWWVLPVLLGFAVLVLAHGRIFSRLERLQGAIVYYEKGVARLEHRWVGMGNDSTRYAGDAHPYAHDLDLFGRGSLFELLCTVQTGIGERTLAEWLLKPAVRAEIEARQGAVAELVGHHALREEVAVSGHRCKPVNPKILIDWARKKPAFGRMAALGLRIGAIGAATFVVISFVLWRLHTWGPLPLLIGLGVNLVFSTVVRKTTSAVLGEVLRPSSELGVVVTLLRGLEHRGFSAAKLQDLKARLAVDGISASEAVGRLERLGQWVASRDNMLFAILSFLFLLPIHLSLAVEAWRSRFGDTVQKWLETVGELEGLCALATYAFEHPSDSFPEICEKNLILEAEALGHPLIPPKGCVKNSVRLDADVRAWIISGSNMSGKTTLLKAVGVNVVLAMAGAPVRAASLRLSPLQVGATIHIEGSLQAGRSRFYAEIKRLKQIMDLTEKEVTVLFLLDELFHGTNSNDRRLGSIALLRAFCQNNAIGLVSTHDLGVAEAAAELGEMVRNYHFTDHVEQGRLVFDYHIRPGVVEHGNAMQLMREIGLLEAVPRD
jgi:hypothetical protein